MPVRCSFGSRRGPEFCLWRSVYRPPVALLIGSGQAGVRAQTRRRRQVRDGRGATLTRLQGFQAYQRKNVLNDVLIYLTGMKREVAGPTENRRNFDWLQQLANRPLLSRLIAQLRPAHAAHWPSASIVALPTVKPSRCAASANAWASSWSSISVTPPQVRQIRNCAAWSSSSSRDAADERRQPLQLVHKPLLLQEIERAIDSGRSRAGSRGAQLVEQIVGARWARRRSRINPST